MNENRKKCIVVAGDVCLDVVGAPIAPVSAGSVSENWRSAGEVRTSFHAGGAMLLADMVAAAVGEPAVVAGPLAVPPDALNGCVQDPVDTAAFIKLAPRLSRHEIVHSLLQLKGFPPSPKSKDSEKKTFRVDMEVGYSGPDDEEDSANLIAMRYDEPDRCDVLVVDDTGNGFRNAPRHYPWPKALTGCGSGKGTMPLVVYKLNRPLPKTADANPLWKHVNDHGRQRRIVVISANDLRKVGARISLGLSWERTALDVVWHLQNNSDFRPLRECALLVVRLGLDGAVVWRHVPAGAESGREAAFTESAWLVYDRGGIEGAFAQNVPGRMVGAGSVFTAALTRAVMAIGNAEDASAVEPLIAGVKAGLLAARRLFVLGFGKKGTALAYPGAELFGEPGDGEDYAAFAHQPVPIIKDALTADRGGWRLLDQIFAGKRSLLQRAVLQVARNAKPNAGHPEYQAEQEAHDLLQQVPLAEFGALRTHDRHEIECYRSVHVLLRDYLRSPKAQRPLSIAVFGPPGAGKSFGVKEVAASLKDQLNCAEVKDLTFNLSLYKSPEELAGAFHLVRDIVLEGKVPLVFFDEFDTALDKVSLGWLQHFLSPMQDGSFLDRGDPHPIGKSIFVFAGGTCATFADFAAHPGMGLVAFKQRKGPDFLSRLRGTLDVPSLNLMTALSVDGQSAASGVPADRPPGTFDPFGPVESLPCEAAILLRRAAILSFNLKKKAPGVVRADKSLCVDVAVLRALLFLPAFEHGNRSFEALMDMSHLVDVDEFTSSQLPPEFQVPLHADAVHFGQLVGTELPFSHADRMLIAEAIHNDYLQQRMKAGEYKKDKPSHAEWADLAPRYVHSNAEQADNIPRKLLALGLWLRKMQPDVPTPAKGAVIPLPASAAELDLAARLEHDRWVALQRSDGYVYGPQEDHDRRTHPCILRWDDERLSAAERAKDLSAISAIADYLAAARYEVIRP